MYLNLIEKELGQTTFDDVMSNNDRDNICCSFSDIEFESLRYHNLATQYAISDYLRQKIKMAKLKEPRNLFAYVKKIIENDKKDVES